MKASASSASALLELVERVLPARFGGSLTDYQFAERESEGVTRLELRVSPRSASWTRLPSSTRVLAHLDAT